MALACLLVTSSAHAALRWENTKQVLAVHPTEVSAVARFSFTNTGTNSITLIETRVTCGCLAPKLSQRTYAPGERGLLRVDFDLRNRTGKQHKVVRVKTNDKIETPLYIECNIPQLYIFESKTLLWRKDDLAKTKSVRLLNSGSIPIRLLSVSSSHDGFPATLTTVREGFEYTLVVSRKTDAANARAVIRIATEPPPGQTAAKTLKFYVVAH